MKELKFRAFDGECFWYTNETMSFFKHFGDVQSSFDDYMEFSEVVEAGWPIDQYTGQVDVNLKEVYDGDIYQYGDDGGVLCVVKWLNESSSFEVDIYRNGNFHRPNESISNYTPNYCHLIGNIHQNSELLTCHRQH